jgi:starch-binding outer membrane protein, SusD/RagB family
MKLKNIIFSSLLALIMVSCQDFLEFEPYGQPSSLGNLTDEQAMQTAYALYEWQYRQGNSGRGFFWYENASDDMITGRTHAQAANVANLLDNGSHTLDLRSNWPEMYRTINYANGIIRQVPESQSISPAIKDKVVGNAYFWRGFAYLWLAPWYGDNGPNGGIPIVTEETAIEDIDVPRPASVLDNYDMIIKDLEKAGQFLPYFHELPKDEWGLVHKTAAWAFAARAALYAAQYDASYYDKVIEYADRVINSGNHDLVANYADVFEISHNWSSEYLYSITSNENNGSIWPGMSFQNAGFGYYNTWGYFQPTLDLYLAFEEGDMRRKKTIIAPGDTVDFVGNLIIWQVNPPSTSSPSHMTQGKWLAPFRGADAIGTRVNPNGNHMTTDLSIPLIRYADVLLMKAEALIWKNGEGDQMAKDLINEIRERAGLPRNTDATKAQLKNERRCEFAFEFGAWRHLDLVRWGDAQAAYSKPKRGFKTNLSGDQIVSLDTVEVWPARNFNPNIHHVFAIPVREIATSKNLKQNQGY